MISSIQARIDAFGQQRRVRAGSLIMSVFGDALLPRGGRAWLGSLVQLLEPLGLNERLVRTSVFRLVKDDWLCTETVGRRADYRLSSTGQRRFEEAARHIYASHAPLWDRRWRLILVVGEISPRPREQLRRALFWQGFGALGAECFVHPSADLAAAFDALAAEGLGALQRQLLPMLAADARSGLSASGSELVQRAWNLQDLSLAYADFVAQYQPILAQLRRAREAEPPPPQAFLLRTLLIHDYRRLLLRDPELPEVLLPTDWPGQMARQVCRDLYRKLLAPSEQHLDAVLRWADGTQPLTGPMAALRFAQDDPLTVLAT